MAVLKVYNGTAWVPVAGGASPPVSSVFGRTGAVVATSGDYTASQVGAAATTHASQHEYGGADQMKPRVVYCQNYYLPFLRNNGQALFLINQVAGHGGGGATQGWLMHRAGDVIGYALKMDINGATASPTADLELFFDGSVQVSVSLGTVVTGDGQKFYGTWSSGTYTFTAGQNVGFRILVTGGTDITFDDTSLSFEVEFDT